MQAPCTRNVRNFSDMRVSMTIIMKEQMRATLKTVLVAIWNKVSTGLFGKPDFKKFLEDKFGIDLTL